MILQKCYVKKMSLPFFKFPQYDENKSKWEGHTVIVTKNIIGMHPKVGPEIGKHFVPKVIAI